MKNKSFEYDGVRDRKNINVSTLCNLRLALLLLLQPY